jgi:hypothetical protein
MPVTSGSRVTVRRNQKVSYRRIYPRPIWDFGVPLTIRIQCETACTKLKTSRFLDASNKKHMIYFDKGESLDPRPGSFSCFVLFCRVSPSASEISKCTCNRESFPPRRFPNIYMLLRSTAFYTMWSASAGHHWQLDAIVRLDGRFARASDFRFGEKIIWPSWLWTIAGPLDQSSGL